jgi:thiol-disulfide isomerase/thioredoxin
MRSPLLPILAGITIAIGTLPAANPPTLALGSRAPDFDLPGVDGRNWKLSDFSDVKILVIVFTCNHCPTAQYYEERLKKLAADYRDRGVTLVAISPNAPDAVRPDELGYTDLGDSLEEMKIRARHREFNFPYLFGGGEHEAVSAAYGPVATPHVFIFDERRVLRYQGRIDDAEREALMKQQDTRRALDALLQGQDPPVTQTKVFGCSVKWSSKAEGVREYWERIAKEPVTLDAVDAEALKVLRKNAASSDEPAKFRLINVWATWCGPCVTEFPDLMMIHRMYRQRPFELVTLAAQYPDEREDMFRFLKKQQASNRNLMFGSTDKYALMEAFDPEWQGALPYTILVNPEGDVIYRRQGAVEALELKRLIVKELNQRKPW